ncbi:MAG TPA: hypothetical protein DCW72_05470 [Elusimicrobia bacterium]|nr:MAG: hypothetical protein A2X29_12130 [Elusimicrobia bacterium GWA2_64_40]OGR63000.1 MAG: hypothetical protein A2X30_04630 [Elusimicrobia bacterium GWB2_63_16]HAU89680.1 hypothetical protein [Elusimicrobiota bacterium]
MKLSVLLAAPALLLAAAAEAQEASVSTAAPAAVQAPAPWQSPLQLTISKDSYNSRVGLDYRIRWDFRDLRAFKPGLGFIYTGLKAFYHWDITENTRLEYYGLRTNPWRLIISREKKNGAAPPSAGVEGGESPVVKRATPEYRKRLRLSVSPLVDDLKRNLDDGLRDFLLRSSLKGASPGWERAGDEGRRAFVKDVLSLGIWDSGVPGFRQAGEGLEYISEEGKNKKKPRRRY